MHFCAREFLLKYRQVRTEVIVNKSTHGSRRYVLIAVCSYTNSRKLYNRYENRFLGDGSIKNTDLFNKLR